MTSLSSHLYKTTMRPTVFTVASLAVLSVLGFNLPQTQAKSLSNRNPNFSPVIMAEKHERRNVCVKRSKKTTKKNTQKNPTSKKTSSTADNETPVQAAAKATSKSSSSSVLQSSFNASASTSTGTIRSASLSTFAGQAPPKSPWGNCFDLTATAFQPNWKGEATTTWCGVNFDKSSPIIALPLAELSKAYGSGSSVTYYSNQALWNQMISDWCGREVYIQGPGGIFRAYYGDANEWTSVDLNMNLYTKVKGVATGSYVDPDAAGWMNGIKGCFTGQQINLKNGYPFSYT